MCGRYVTVSKVVKVEKRFNAVVKEPDLFTPNTNVSIGQLAPVITNSNPGEIEFFRFGLTPFWAKKKMYLINARSEGDNNKENDPNYSGAKGIISKPAFRQSIRQRRCLVIADCFIEGPEKEKLSKPYVVYLKDQVRPFAFAGIWDEWEDKEKGEKVRSFSIITTTANALLQKIGHHRSPVILHPEDERHWLDNELPLGDVTSLLKPYPDDAMNAYPISPEIKNPRANGMDLLQPIGERVVPEYDLEIQQDLELFGMGQTRSRKRRLDEGD